MYDIYNETEHTARLYPQGETLAYARVSAPECWVLAAPDARASRLSQYTYGERLRVLKQEGDFYHVQSARDAYSGWVLAAALEILESPPEKASYKTLCITTVHEDASMKSPIAATLPPDACVSPSDKKDGYCLLPSLGWVNCFHLASMDSVFDPIQTARAHLGRSYVWGGRGIAGLDCSALAQLCYRFAGRNIPRDSDLQMHFMKRFHRRVELSELERSDLIFLPGHVMIAADAYTVIHATAHEMRVVIEDLHTVLQRSSKQCAENFYVRAYHWHQPQPYVHIF